MNGPSGPTGPPGPPGLAVSVTQQPLRLCPLFHLLHACINNRSKWSYMVDP